MELSDFAKEGLALAGLNGKKNQSDRFSVPGWSFSSDPELEARKKQKIDKKIHHIIIHHNGESHVMEVDFILHPNWIQHFNETVEALERTGAEDHIQEDHIEDQALAFF
tara:strand:+ start:240 stop:566 length:327 start_codon:yes stop_codon:yes gene_type:complete